MPTKTTKKTSTPLRDALNAAYSPTEPTALNDAIDTIVLLHDHDDGSDGAAFDLLKALHAAAELACGVVDSRMRRDALGLPPRVVEAAATKPKLTAIQRLERDLVQYKTTTDALIANFNPKIKPWDAKGYRAMEGQWLACWRQWARHISQLPVDQREAEDDRLALIAFGHIIRPGQSTPEQSARRTTLRAMGDRLARGGRA